MRDPNHYRFRSMVDLTASDHTRLPIDLNLATPRAPFSLRAFDPGFFNAFSVKLDADGNHLWSRALGGLGIAVGVGVAVDGAGNVLLTGSCTGMADFGGGPAPLPRSGLARIGLH